MDSACAPASQTLLAKRGQTECTKRGGLLQCGRPVHQHLKPYPCPLHLRKCVPGYLLTAQCNKWEGGSGMALREYMSLPTTSQKTCSWVPSLHVAPFGNCRASPIALQAQPRVTATLWPYFRYLDGLSAVGLYLPSLHMYPFAPTGPTILT